ncbi:MAG: hypothetical protein NT116_05320 [Candidatus Parcubacteria bacterium]|nr:hypothetical protein [Candidatus Parcubacteria bacterium]
MKYHEEQFQFANLLFDSLFGLVIYFSLDSFLEIKEPLHLIFYLFTLIVVIHWWLMFKSASEMFGKITQRSALNIVLNIIYIILLQYYILMAAEFSYNEAIIFVFILILIDILWCLMWAKILPQRAKGHSNLPIMLVEIFNIIKTNLVLVFALLFLIIANKFLVAPLYIFIFIAVYIVYIIMTFKYEIIDLDII